LIVRSEDEERRDNGYNIDNEGLLCDGVYAVL
jgi:hypothetical protein